MAFSISTILFIISGAGILVSVPFLAGAGFSVWLLAKVAYFAGVAFFIFRK